MQFSLAPYYLCLDEIMGDSACYLLHAGFLFGLLFNPEDGGNTGMLVNFHQTTQRYIPENITLLNQTTCFSSC
jgi:hypothetical protein